MFLQIYHQVNTFLLSVSLPIFAQQDPEDLNPYQRIARSFREGPDPRPIYVGAIVLIIFLVIAYWILRMYTDFLAESESKGSTVGILEGIQKNIKLSNKQERYLKALIEKFQDKHRYDPEIKTEYLEQFLFFAIQSLTHAPDRAIRRKTHYVPTFEENDTLEVMFKIGDTTYTTEICKIVEQSDDSVAITKPEDVDLTELREGRQISCAYHEGELTLRGQAEIRHIMDEKILLVFPEGMHFEEHRTYDRVDVDEIPCQVILQEFEGEAIKLNGIILDLSVGGAQIKVQDYNEKIHENMRGSLQFKPEEGYELDLDIALVHLEL
ncbi:MAG: hypothetical protein ABEK50_12360, partial [bacterium]